MKLIFMISYGRASERSKTLLIVIQNHLKAFKSKKLKASLSKQAQNEMGFDNDKRD